MIWCPRPFPAFKFAMLVRWALWLAGSVSRWEMVGLSFCDEVQPAKPLAVRGTAVGTCHAHADGDKSSGVLM